MGEYEREKTYNEEELENLTHDVLKAKKNRRVTYLKSLCNWIVGQRIGRIIQTHKLLRAAKLWRAIIAERTRHQEDYNS